MGTMLDLMLSVILGGILMMIVLDANEIAVENQSVYNGDMLVQEMLTSVAQVVEGEIRNMGFGVPEKDAGILYADTSRIIFLTDLSRSGVSLDTIQYLLGDTLDLAYTQNELDRLLYRRVNSQPVTQIGAVTLFHLSYITKSGEVLTTPVTPSRLTEIHVVEVTIEVQNPHAMTRRSGENIGAGERTALYSSSLWQQTRLASQNSRR
jgi:hypothetical protein